MFHEKNVTAPVRTVSIFIKKNKMGEEEQVIHDFKQRQEQFVKMESLPSMGRMILAQAKDSKDQRPPAPPLKRRNSHQQLQFLQTAFHEQHAEESKSEEPQPPPIVDRIQSYEYDISLHHEKASSPPEEEVVVETSWEEQQDVPASDVGVVHRKQSNTETMVARTDVEPVLSPSKLSRKYKRALQSTRGIFSMGTHLGKLIVEDLKSHQLVALMLLVFSMLSETMVPAPRYNFPIGAVLISLPYKSFRGRYVMTGLGFTVLTDLYWLLRPPETSFGATFGSKAVAVSRLSLACCVMLKIWLIFSVYFYLHTDFSTNEDKAPTGKYWKRYKYFFPRQTLPRRQNLSYEVIMRIVAVLWIHCVCGTMFLLLGLIGMAAFSNSLHFIDSTFGMRLHIAMLLKALTTFSTLMAASSNIQLKGCLGLYGCFDSRQTTRKPLVKYTKSWTTRVGRFKAADTVAGVYLMLVLFSAAHRTNFYSFGQALFLTLTQAIALIVDLWSTLLLLVIYRCARSLHAIFQTSNDADIDVYMPEQLEHIYENEESSSEESSSDDDSSSSNDSSSSDEEAKEVDIQVAVNYNDWHRQFDEYGRPYLVNPETGETSWDWDVEHDVPIASTVLSSDIYLTNEEFNALWEETNTVGDFQCHVGVIPSTQDLQQHLENGLFWVVSEFSDDDYLTVYFYATMADNSSHFLAEFVFDYYHMTLHVVFKSENDQHAKEYVKLLRLKDIIGQYQPM